MGTLNVSTNEENSSTSLWTMHDPVIENLIVECISSLLLLCLSSFGSVASATFCGNFQTSHVLF
jgi:hypothetical protein